MRCNYGICKYSILRKFKRTYEKKPGLTLEKLSEKSGVSISLLSRYSNQTTSTPSLSSLISIARGLDVGIDDLILSKEKVQENSVVVGKVAMTIRNM